MCNDEGSSPTIMVDGVLHNLGIVVYILSGELNRSEMKRQRLKWRLQSDVETTHSVGWIKPRIAWTCHSTTVVVPTFFHAVRLLIVPIAN